MTPGEPARLQCTVRGCQAPLTLGERTATCPRGHEFDRAKRGYWNLLQPQDRRSLDAGDSKDVVAARRRLFEAGFFQPLTTLLHDLLCTRSPTSLLDLGCGEGSHLAALCSALGAQGVGVDLSSPAIDLAARSFPGPTWLVANADRGVPLLEASVDAVLSITARRPMAEMARVLRPGGVLLVVVPAAEDLGEIRAVLLGEDEPRDRSATLLAELAQVPGAFSTEESRTVRQRCRLDRQGVADLVATTYRGGRKSREASLAALTEIESEVTGVWSVTRFERTGGRGL